MKISNTFLIVVLLANSIFAQNKHDNCKYNYLFLKNWIEKNSASFSDNVKGERKLLYIKHCDSIQQVITGRNNACLTLLQSYLSFFQDNHIGVSIQFDDTDTNQLRQFYMSSNFLNTKTILLNSNQLHNLEKKDSLSVEGIYIENGNDFYKVAVIKTFDDKYSGVILNSKTPLWKNGQVKFEFKFEDDTTVNYTLYNRKHQSETGEGKFIHSNLTGINYRKTNSSAYSDASSLYNFKTLNDSTCYLKVSSFGGWLYKQLDSFYSANMKIIKSKPFLIIDIRNNGGGSDVCYDALKPLFYTNPIESDIVDILATPENLKLYRDELKIMLSDTTSYGVDAIMEKKREISVMENTKPYHFATLQARQYFTLKSILPYPKKIALIFNKGTASSAEDLIFDAIQSKKVITIGENSSGDTGYGNVYDVSIPNSNITFSYTTTKYRIQKKYDGIGFTPMYKISSQENIIKQAVELLNK